MKSLIWPRDARFAKVRKLRKKPRPSMLRSIRDHQIMNNLLFTGRVTVFRMLNLEMSLPSLKLKNTKYSKEKEQISLWIKRSRC